MNDTIIQELAPQGTLRAAVNLLNFLLVSGRGPAGEPHGVGPDMARAIADRLGVGLQLVPYATPGELADAAGSRRLIGGQMEDVLAEKRADVSPADLDFIHLNKTAAMIEASLVMGGLIGGASAPALDTLRAAGRATGLAFQIVDDILDATADTATLGKTAGKDARAGKATYVRIHGLEASRRIACEHTAAALSSLARLPDEPTFLRALIASMAARAS